MTITFLQGVCVRSWKLKSLIPNTPDARKHPARRNRDLSLSIFSLRESRQKLRCRGTFLRINELQVEPILGTLGCDVRSTPGHRQEYGCARIGRYIPSPLPEHLELAIHLSVRRPLADRPHLASAPELGAHIDPEKRRLGERQVFTAKQRHNSIQCGRPIRRSRPLIMA